MSQNFRPRISHVVCCDANGAIGKEGGLLYSLPQDMKHFSDLTKGHCVLMGRKTWESIPHKHRPLKQRHNLVLSSSSEYSSSFEEMDYPFVSKTVDNFDEAIRFCEKNGIQELFVIGGQSIYEQTFKMIDRAVVTKVNHAFKDADTFYLVPEDFHKKFAPSLVHSLSDSQHDVSVYYYERLAPR